jgi:energy-coupling factor transport system permease protein
MLVTWNYRIRNSFMEKVDPRARWIFSLLFLFSVTFFWDIRYLIFFFVVAMAWYLSARTRWRETRRAWTLITILLTMMILVNTIITSGGAVGIIPKVEHAVWEFKGVFPLTHWPIYFKLTIERLWYALAQALRILSISAIFIIIPYSMDPRLYGVTFRGMGLPDRFAFSMDLAFRYVPTLARDFNVTLDAQRARGYEIERVEGGIIAQVRKVAPLIVPITMGSILTGEDVTNAMDLRCFGLCTRTWVQKLLYHWYDYAVIAFAVIVFITSAVLSIMGYGKFWIPDALINLVV